MAFEASEPLEPLLPARAAETSLGMADVGLAMADIDMVLARAIEVKRRPVVTDVADPATLRAAMRQRAGGDDGLELLPLGSSAASARPAFGIEAAVDESDPEAVAAELLRQASAFDASRARMRVRPVWAIAATDVRKAILKKTSEVEISPGENSNIVFKQPKNLRAARSRAWWADRILSLVVDDLRAECRKPERADDTPENNDLRRQLTIAVAGQRDYQRRLSAEFPYRQGLTRFIWGSGEGSPASYGGDLPVAVGSVAAAVTGIVGLSGAIGMLAATLETDPAVLLGGMALSAALVSILANGCKADYIRYGHQPTNVIKALATLLGLIVGIVLLARVKPGAAPGSFELITTDAFTSLTPRTVGNDTWLIPANTTAISHTSAGAAFEFCFENMGMGATVNMTAPNGTVIEVPVPGHVCLQGDAAVANEVLSSLSMTAEGRRFIDTNATLAVEVTDTHTGEKRSGTIVNADIEPWPEFFDFEANTLPYNTTLPQGGTTRLMGADDYFKAPEGTDAVAGELRFSGLTEGAVLQVNFDRQAFVVTAADPIISLAELGLEIDDLNDALGVAEIKLVEGGEDAISGVGVAISVTDVTNQREAKAELGSLNLGPAPASYFQFTDSPFDADLVPGSGDDVSLLSGAGFTISPSHAADSLNSTITFTGLVEGQQLLMMFDSKPFTVNGNTDGVVQVALPKMTAEDLDAALRAGSLSALRGTDSTTEVAVSIKATDEPWGRDAEGALGSIEFGPQPEFSFVDTHPQNGGRYVSGAEPVSLSGYGQFESNYEGDTLTGYFDITCDLPTGASFEFTYNGTTYVIDGEGAIIPFAGTVDEVNAAFRAQMDLSNFVIPDGLPVSAISVDVVATDREGKIETHGSMLNGQVSPVPKVTLEVDPSEGEVFEPGEGIDFDGLDAVIGSSIEGDIVNVNVTASGLPEGTTATITLDGKAYPVPGEPVAFKGTVADAMKWFNTGEFTVDTVPAGTPKTGGVVVKMTATDQYGAPMADATLITGSVMPDPVLTVTKPTSPTGVFSKGTVPIPGAAVSSTVGADRGSANMTVTFPGYVAGVDASVSLGSFGSFPIAGETTTIALPESAMTDLSTGLGALQLQINNIPAGLAVADIRFGLSVADVNGAPVVEVKDFADVDVSPELDWRFDPPAVPASGVFQPGQSIDLGGGAFHSTVGGDRLVQPGSNVTMTWPGYVEGVEASVLFNGTRYDITGSELVIPFDGSVADVDAALAGSAENPFRLDITTIPPGTNPSGLGVVVSGRDADGPNTASGSLVDDVRVIPTPELTVTDNPVTGVSKSGTATSLAGAGLQVGSTVGGDTLKTSLTVDGLPAGGTATVVIGGVSHTFPGPEIELSGDKTALNAKFADPSFAVTFGLPAGTDPTAVTVQLGEVTDSYGASISGVKVADLTAIPTPAVTVTDSPVDASLRAGQSTSLAAAKVVTASTVGGDTLTGSLDVKGLPSGATAKIIYAGKTYSFPGGPIPVSGTAGVINADFASPDFVMTIEDVPAGTSAADVTVSLSDLTDSYGAPPQQVTVADITVLPEFHIVPGVVKASPAGAAVPLCPASGEGGACQAWTEHDSVDGLILTIPYGSGGLYAAPGHPAEVSVTGGSGSPWNLVFPASVTGSEANTLLEQVTIELPGVSTGFEIKITGGAVDGETVSGQTIADVETVSLDHDRGHHLRGMAPEESADADLSNPRKLVAGHRGALVFASHDNAEDKEPSLWDRVTSCFR